MDVTRLRKCKECGEYLTPHHFTKEKWVCNKCSKIEEPKETKKKNKPDRFSEWIHKGHAERMDSYFEWCKEKGYKPHVLEIHKQ